MAPVILLAIFLGIPLIEIALFIEVGDRIGLGWTLAAIVLTAMLGTALLRLQGLATLRRAQDSMARGEMPVGAVFDGACLLIAGLLLLTPGFFTDALGLLLFLPPVRTGLGLLLVRGLRSGAIHMRASMEADRPFRQPSGFGARGFGPTVDGEWRDLTPEADSATDSDSATPALPPRRDDPLP